MITTDEIKNLAHLARIEVTDEELAMYAHDFESILKYVEQISNVDVSSIETKPEQFNIARNDEHPHESGQFVETLLAEAPDAQNGFYKVPKIL